MPTYHLAVRRIEQTCLFELNWGQRQRLSAQVPYPEQLTRAYTDWQRAYLGYYKHALRGRPGATGTVASLPINWHSELAQTEAKLLSEFHRWLRSGDLHEIRDAIAHPNSTQSETDTTELFLTCEPIDIARLPWEAWEIGKVQPLRIARSPANIRAEASPRPTMRRGQLRILVIMGDDSGIEIKSDVEAIQQAFKGLGYVQVEGWQRGQDPLQVRDKIRDALIDPQGWDILFFSGHSDEAKVVGGEVLVAPQVSISIREIVHDLDVAKRNGLQFALFNSCAGLDIAETLVESGLSQVAIMREKIHNQVAQTFLVQFLEGLANYLDVHDALLKACQHLKLETHLTYPSAYLVPSFFRHPDAELFQLKPAGWKTWLKQLKPTKPESAVLGAAVLLSLLPPVHYWLMEQRVAVQATYRQLTGQLAEAAETPIVLIQIDDASLQAARISEPLPMDRSYLAELVTQATALDVQVLGIDYLLDRPRPGDAALNQALQQAVEQGVWPVLGTKRSHQGDWLSVWSEVADPAWSLQGDMWVPLWNVLPLWPDDRPRPLSYQLAIATQLQAIMQPSLDGQQSLSSQVEAELRSEMAYLEPNPARLHPLTKFSYRLRQRWLQPLLDFSIPPEQVYQTIPAWQLLESPELVLQQLGLESLEDAVVMIVAGGYDEAGVTVLAEDNFPTPSAIAYWRSQAGDPNRGFTGGEAHAYMTHHFLTRHFVVPIPDLWMVLLAVLVGKALSLWLIPAMVQQPRRVMLLLLAGLVGYGLVSLQLYVMAEILLPWLLPTVVIWPYVVLKLRRLNHV